MSDYFVWETLTLKGDSQCSPEVMAPKFKSLKKNISHLLGSKAWKLESGGGGLLTVYLPSPGSKRGHVPCFP
jgi:hypothetical protein